MRYLVKEIMETTSSQSSFAALFALTTNFTRRDETTEKSNQSDSIFAFFPPNKVAKLLHDLDRILIDQCNFAVLCRYSLSKHSHTKT